MTVRPVRDFDDAQTLRHGTLRRAVPAPARARHLRRAVAVRGDVRLARPRRRRDRRDGRGGRASLRCGLSMWDAIVARARGREHALAQLRFAPRARAVSRSSRRSRSPRSRSASRRSTRATSSTTAARASSRRPTATTALLLGDYLYAHGLVRIAEAGGVDAVADDGRADLAAAASSARRRRRRRRPALGRDRRRLGGGSTRTARARRCAARDPSRSRPRPAPPPGTSRSSVLLRRTPRRLAKSSTRDAASSGLIFLGVVIALGEVDATRAGHLAVGPIAVGASHYLRHRRRWPGRGPAGLDRAPRARRRARPRRPPRSTPSSRSRRSSTARSRPAAPRSSSSARRARAHPLLINQFGTERRMCLAFGVEQLDDVARKLERRARDAAAGGARSTKVRGLRKLKSIADSLPETVRSGAVPGGRARRATTSTSAAAGADLLAGRRRRRSSRCPP